MKLRTATLSLLAVCLTAVPAMADTIYSNGPINGTSDAWTINFGFAVSDTFTLASQTQLDGLTFGAWVFPGEVLQIAEVLIGTSEFSGNVLDQVVNFSQTNCSGNQYGYNVCFESANLSTAVNLAAGTYWLTLENAAVNTDDPVFWDENSGPSSASQNSVGTIPSEAFTLTGRAGTTCSTCRGSVPEPSSITLFGAGILGVAGVLGRKLF